MEIRRAAADDIPRMVALSDRKRTEYAAYSPRFWRKAEGAAEKQARFFAAQLEREGVLALVAEETGGAIAGFVIAALTSAPPVYDPGGPVCVVDDFAVASPERWPELGEALRREVTARAAARGAVLLVVVCAHLDEPKRAMLRAIGASVTSEWYVKPIG